MRVHELVSRTEVDHSYLMRQSLPLDKRALPMGSELVILLRASFGRPPAPTVTAQDEALPNNLLKSGFILRALEELEPFYTEKPE